MICQKCGLKYDDTSVSCPKCGEDLSNEENIKANPSKKSSVNQIPFRDEFYHHIKGFLFLTVVFAATIYYIINIINSAFHFSLSDISSSLVSILYGLISLGLIVPSLWMIYLDKSPHSAFSPLKFLAFINCLKIFLSLAFGVLTIMGALMGKEEISNNILYLSHESTSVYMVALLSQAVKNPSFMLISTAGIMWVTYIMTGFMYNISLAVFLNSASKRINDNTTNPSGYRLFGAMSFFVAIINLIYGVSMALMMKDDIYNILATTLSGIFHFLVYLDIRKFSGMFAIEEPSEEPSEVITEN